MEVAHVVREMGVPNLHRLVDYANPMAVVDNAALKGVIKMLTKIVYVDHMEVGNDVISMAVQNGLNVLAFVVHIRKLAQLHPLPFLLEAFHAQAFQQRLYLLWQDLQFLLFLLLLGICSKRKKKRRTVKPF
jgi:hypothetical protein